MRNTRSWQGSLPYTEQTPAGAGRRSAGDGAPDHCRRGHGVRKVALCLAAPVREADTRPLRAPDARGRPGIDARTEVVRNVQDARIQNRSHDRRPGGRSPARRPPWRRPAERGRRRRSAGEDPGADGARSSARPSTCTRRSRSRFRRSARSDAPACESSAGGLRDPPRRRLTGARSTRSPRASPAAIRRWSTPRAPTGASTSSTRAPGPRSAAAATRPRRPRPSRTTGRRCSTRARARAPGRSAVNHADGDLGGVVRL